MTGCEDVLATGHCGGVPGGLGRVRTGFPEILHSLLGFGGGPGEPVDELGDKCHP